jgi:hypothetical protein
VTSPLNSGSARFQFGEDLDRRVSLISEHDDIDRRLLIRIA